VGVLALMPLDASSPLAALAVAAVFALGLATGRAAPAASLVIASALSLCVNGGGAGLAGPLTAAVVLGFLAGRRMTRPREAQYAFAAVSAAGLLGTVALAEWTDWVNVLLTQFTTAVLPWWAGSWWRQRGELIRAEAERVEQARLRERARIAQDMHDSLGHELSLMALVAGGLELAPGLAPEHRETAARLRAGAVSATERLHEIIGLLGLGPGGGDDIAALVERARRSGVRVALEQRGTPGGSSGHAARRVVQEALTNAIKHAPGAEVTVLVTHESGETLVSVTNTPATGGRSPSPSGSGTGLISLDERARLAGGTLRAGPREGGGYEVTARLPHATPPGEATPPPAREGPRGRRCVLLRVSALPLTVAGALAAFLLGTYIYTVRTTSLDHADYDGLRMGASRAEVAAVLPSHSIDESPSVLNGPPPPDGARCEYYRAGSNFLDLSGSLYRLCFDGGVLVAKDTMHTGSQRGSESG
jgi:signal transduction histidine kinase